jgi:3-phenylpropionate/trans-cinnamate dioxygenase ferredoxin component
MAEFHEVAKLKDVPTGKALRVDVDGVEVCVVNTEGQVFAIDDICSHAEVALSEGEVDGCTIECWLHGSRFDLRTGIPSGPPAVEPVPVYEVRVDGEGEDAVISVAVTKGVGHTWQN